MLPNSIDLAMRLLSSILDRNTKFNRRISHPKMSMFSDYRILQIQRRFNTAVCKISKIGMLSYNAVNGQYVLQGDDSPTTKVSKIHVELHYHQQDVPLFANLYNVNDIVKIKYSIYFGCRLTIYHIRIDDRYHR